MSRKASIIGLGKYIPPRVLTNSDLEKMVDTSDEWITTRTGIKERHIVEDNVSTSDIAFEAAVEALKNSGVSAEEIDLIIVGTVTADMAFPATSCIVQNRIGAVNAATFDLEAGCSGFVYSLAVAAQFIETGLYKNALVIGAETLTKITDWEDRSTCVLFGDGAGAAVLTAVNKGGFLAFDLGADGSGGKSLYLPAGGSLKPFSKTTVEEREHFIKMEGNQVFKFAVKAMSKSSIMAVEKAGIRPEDVDLFVPHQANIRIIQAAASRLNLSDDKVFINLPKYGNTSGASIPIALAEAHEEGLINNGDYVVLVAFGAGLTWASTVIEWNEGE